MKIGCRQSRRPRAVEKVKYATLVLFAGGEKLFCRRSARACDRDKKGHISTGGGIHFRHPFPPEPPQRRHLSYVYCRKSPAKRVFRQSEIIPKVNSVSFSQTHIPAPASRPRCIRLALICFAAWIRRFAKRFYLPPKARSMLFHIVPSR